MSVAGSAAGRSACAPVREWCDLNGINRNYAVGTCVILSGIVVFVLISVSDGCLETPAACAAAGANPDSIMCNCVPFKWTCLGLFSGLFGLGIFAFEYFSGEGAAEMKARQEARAAANLC